MGWWSRLFGRSQASAPTTKELPGEVELIPGRLVARVVAHEVPLGDRTLPCWTYTTHGLAAVGQDELIFTLRRRSGEPATAVPTDPFTLMKQVFSLAEQGRAVGPMGYTVFGSPRGFLGVTQQVGIVYARPPAALPDIPVASVDQTLVVILLRPEEAAVVQRVGAYRVLTLLGREARYYPYPFWSDRDRAAVINEAAAQASVMSKVSARIGCPEASVRVSIPDVPRQVGAADREVSGFGDTIEFWLTKTQAAKLADTLRSFGPSGSCVLTTTPDPSADVRLVWEPGLMEVQTITPGGSKAQIVTGGYLIVVFGPDLQDGARVVEDGFAVIFRPETWERVLSAMTNGEGLHVPGQNPKQQGFAIRFRS
ncbi:MAG: hypothetical protein JWO38_4437 [Gemmataceae bacterium]|nr:hypothetical protein [Gemmataceae bacterium]